MDRFITVWRKTGDHFLDWDHYISLDQNELGEVIKNLNGAGVRQYSTFPIGKRMDECSKP